MRIWCKSFIDMATEQICDKYSSYSLEYPDEEELLDALWTYINNHEGISYQIFIGTLLINYVEANSYLLFEDNGFARKIRDAEFNDIIDWFESDIDLLDDVIQSTLELSSASKEEKEEKRQIVINSEFANIYSRFDPLFEKDQIFHDMNYPKDPIKKIDSEFYDMYFYLKEHLTYKDHVFYILKDFIKTKYSKEETANLLESLSTSYYFFTKGRVLLQDQDVNPIEKTLLNKLEENQDIKDDISLLQENDEYLNLVIEKCCYYQEHLFDKEQIAIYQKQEQLQYMKKFPPKAKENIPE